MSVEFNRSAGVSDLSMGVEFNGSAGLSDLGMGVEFRGVDVPYDEMGV